MSNSLVSSHSRVFIIEGQARGDHRPEYFGSLRATALSRGFGDIDFVEKADESIRGQFTETGEVISVGEKPSVSVEGHYASDLKSTLLRLAQEGCPVDLQFHMGNCQNPTLFDEFEKIIVVEGAHLKDWSTDDIGALSQDDISIVNEVVEIVAREMYETNPVGYGLKTAQYTSSELLDVDVCTNVSCDGCGVCNLVVAISKSPGGDPTTKADILVSWDGGATWDTPVPITSLIYTENPSAIACFGVYLVVVSNDSKSLHYALIESFDGLSTPTWTEISTGFVTSGAPNDIFYIDGVAFIVGNGGYVYLCERPSSGVSVLNSGTATTSNLLRVHAISSEFAVAVGKDGAIVFTDDGTAWVAAPSSPVAVGTDLNCVFVKSETEWWVGSNAGKLYYTLDQGKTWTEKAFYGSGTGQVRDIFFSTKSVGWISHSTAAPHGRVLRTYNGGYSWNVTPEGDTNLATNDRINRLVGCPFDSDFIVCVGLSDNGIDGFSSVGDGNGRRSKNTNIPPATDMLVYDEFMGSLPVGGVHNTPARPGPGRRYVVDTEGKAYTNHLLIFTGGKAAPAWGNPGVWYEGQTKVAGRLFAAQILPDSLNLIVGMDSNQSGVARNGVRFAANSIWYYGDGIGSVTLRIREASIALVAVAMRANGQFVFLNQGMGWELIWHNLIDSYGTIYPAITNWDSLAMIQKIAVPTAVWLPTPLISDGFGVAGDLSDGAGHPEVAGIGSGGNGKTWTSSVGTWGNAAGVSSASVLVGGLALRTVDSEDTSVVIDVALTIAAGVAGCVFWYADSNNYMRAFHDGTNVTVERVLAGVPGTLIGPVAAAYAAGRVLRIVTRDRIVRVFYNEVKLGGDMPINDAILLAATKVGLYTTNIGNTFDNFLVYATGILGEYDSLDDETSIALPYTRNFLSVGDSKSASVCYQPYLCDILSQDTGERWAARPIRFASSGYTTDEIWTVIRLHLGVVPDTPAPEYVFINLGANDVPAMPLEADWKADYTAILDALHIKWPNAKMYCMRVWRRTYDAECDTLAGWISDVVATRSTFAFLGPDERIFLENGDNGVTYTTDGTHPNEAGYLLTAQEWHSLL